MKTIDEMIAVLTAAKDGKQIQIRKIGDVAWADSAPQIWNWAWYDYRIAPDPEPEPPKVEPWTFETAPQVIPVRRKSDGRLFRMSAFPDGPYLSGRRDTLSEDIEPTWERLAEHFEQLDGSPCGVVREPEPEWPKWYKSEVYLWSVDAGQSVTAYTLGANDSFRVRSLSSHDLDGDPYVTRITATEAATVLANRK